MQTSKAKRNLDVPERAYGPKWIALVVTTDGILSLISPSLAYTPSQALLEALYPLLGLVRPTLEVGLSKNRVYIDNRTHDLDITSYPI